MTTTDVVQHSLNELADNEWDALEMRVKRLARVSFLPEAFRNKPDDIMAAGLALNAVGLPLTPRTISYVYVVKGRVDFMYQLIATLAHQHGAELWISEESDTSATVCGRRAGSDRVHSATFTIEDARKAGLIDKNPTYKAYTRDMLVARAGKRCANRVVPEATLTLPPTMRFVPSDDRPMLVVDDSTGQILENDDDIADAELVDDDDQVSGSGSTPPAGEAEGQEAESPPQAAPPPPTVVEKLHARLRALPVDARSLAWDEWQKALLPPPPEALSAEELTLAEAILAEAEAAA